MTMVIQSENYKITLYRALTLLVITLFSLV